MAHLKSLPNSLVRIAITFSTSSSDEEEEDPSPSFFFVMCNFSSNFSAIVFRQSQHSRVKTTDWTAGQLSYTVGFIVIASAPPSRLALSCGGAPFSSSFCSPYFVTCVSLGEREAGRKETIRRALNRCAITSPPPAGPDVCTNVPSPTALVTFSHTTPVAQIISRKKKVPFF